MRLLFAQRGRGAGGYMAAFFLGNFLSPLVVTAVAAKAGGLFASIGLLSTVCAGVALVSLILVLLRRGPTEAVDTHVNISLPH